MISMILFWNSMPNESHPFPLDIYRLLPWILQLERQRGVCKPKHFLPQDRKSIPTNAFRSLAIHLSLTILCWHKQVYQTFAPIDLKFVASPLDEVSILLTWHWTDLIWWPECFDNGIVCYFQDYVVHNFHAIWHSLTDLVPPCLFMYWTHVILSDLKW